MGENTKIEWADHTFNPWVGCERVSRACDFCYAETWARRTGHPELWQGQRRLTSDANWRLPYKWNKVAHGLARRPRVFCASLADVFDNQVPEAWRNRLWEVIATTRNLDWLLLTKRPQNIAKMLPPNAIETLSRGAAWPWSNVWLGTTVENQEEADRRIPILLDVPAEKHFISAEPLLGPINLTFLHSNPKKPGDLLNALTGARGQDGATYYHPIPNQKLDWVIAGGESGSNARPLSIHWARELRDQCQIAGVAFFWKQWGEWVPAGAGPSDEPGRYAFGDYEYDRAMHECGEGRPRHFTTFGARSVMKRVGKKAAGRLLDGREWNEVPA